jgi:uncharacterized protein
MPRCPVCDASVDVERTPTVPFCSDRCRLVDLGRWLNESYAVPQPRRPGSDASPNADGEADEAE